MKFRNSVAALTLSAMPLAAQDRPEGGVAPDAVYDIAPQLGRYTDEVLFGQVWPSDTLSQRDRSIVTVSALIAMGRAEQLNSHARIALENGVTPEEISEILAHMAFYAGWPAAISSVYVVEEVFEREGVSAEIDIDPDLLDQDADAESARAATVNNTMRPIAPAFADETDEVLFGDLWLRPGLAPRDRSLATVSALIAMGQADQLPFHLGRAIDAGLTVDEAQAMLQHIAHYVGWPKASSAIGPMGNVLREKGLIETAAAEITVVRPGDAEASIGAPENFTGEARVTSRFAAPDAAMGGGMVEFEAGAHTAWHTHPLGQTLYVTAGCALVQAEGQPPVTAGPGEIVQIPPHVRHWHGATADQPMSHLALSESSDGQSVTWMDLVADEDYTAAQPASTC